MTSWGFDPLPGMRIPQNGEAKGSELLPALSRDLNCSVQSLAAVCKGTGWAPGCADASTREYLALLQEQLNGALLAASYRITAYFLIKMLNSA